MIEEEDEEKAGMITNAEDEDEELESEGNEGR